VSVLPVGRWVSVLNLYRCESSIAVPLSSVKFRLEDKPCYLNIIFQHPVALVF
jgi:hypothetical protein